MERGLAESRARARAAIEAGGVTAGGRPVLRASELLDETCAIAAAAAHPWVGRGALKLLHALDAWPVAVAGRIVLDLGASTGGFTQVCLARGAAHVYAVDVGHGQLHSKLAADPRVTSLERTDARALTREQLPRLPDLVVADLSFISLAKALPVPLALAAPAADLVVLVKPQFEVGPARVGKGGVVRDAAARADALADVAQFLAASGWTVEASLESPVVGGDGNREWLLWARRPASGEACAKAPEAAR